MGATDVVWQPGTPATQGGGTHRWDRVDLLGGLLACVCGRRLKSDGTFADGRHRKHHPNPCEAWGRKAHLGDETWETPVLAQVAGIALDEDTIASVVSALGSKGPGLLRSGPVFVQHEPSGRIVYEGPDADRVPAFMDDLMASLNQPCSMRRSDSA